MILTIISTFIPDISFTSNPGKLCSAPIPEFHIGPPTPADDSGNYDNCKRWCVARSDCDGFVSANGFCFFANDNCRRLGLVRVSDVLTFLKEVNCQNLPGFALTDATPVTNMTVISNTSGHFYSSM